MGKSGNLLRSLAKAFKSPSKDSNNNHHPSPENKEQSSAKMASKEKRRWSLGKSASPSLDTENIMPHVATLNTLPIQECPDVNSVDSNGAPPEDRVSTAVADRDEEWAVVKIQTAFRHYLVGSLPKGNRSPPLSLPISAPTEDGDIDLTKNDVEANGNGLHAIALGDDDNKGQVSEGVERGAFTDEANAKMEENGKMAEDNVEKSKGNVEKAEESVDALGGMSGNTGILKLDHHPSVPSYMATTQSSKAKARLSGSPKTEKPSPSSTSSPSTSSSKRWDSSPRPIHHGRIQQVK